MYMHKLGQGVGELYVKISSITLSLGMGEGGTTEDQHSEAHLLQFHDSLGLFSCLTSIDWEIIRRSIFLFFSQVR